MRPEWPPAGLVAKLDEVGFAVVVGTEDALRSVRLQDGDVDVVLVGGETDAVGLAARVDWLRSRVHAPIACVAAAEHVDSATHSGADLVLPGDVDVRAVLFLARCGGEIVAAPTASASICWGPLRLEAASRQVYWRGVQTHVTDHQFRLLAALCGAAGGALTTGELATALYGDPTGEDRERVLAHVRRIRRLFEAPSGPPQFLLTVRGIGFRLADQDAVVTVPSPRASLASV
jgi:DNA-binding response OmpR family regulator